LIDDYWYYTFHIDTLAFSLILAFSSAAFISLFQLRHFRRLIDYFSDISSMIYYYAIIFAIIYYYWYYYADAIFSFFFIIYLFIDAIIHYFLRQPAIYLFSLFSFSIICWDDISCRYYYFRWYDIYCLHCFIFITADWYFISFSTFSLHMLFSSLYFRWLNRYLFHISYIYFRIFITFFHSCHFVILLSTYILHYYWCHYYYCHYYYYYLPFRWLRFDSATGWYYFHYLIVYDYLFHFIFSIAFFSDWCAFFAARHFATPLSFDLPFCHDAIFALYCHY